MQHEMQLQVSAHGADGQLGEDEMYGVISAGFLLKREPVWALFRSVSDYIMMHRLRRRQTRGAPSLHVPTMQWLA